MNWLRQLFYRHRRYDELSESIREQLDEKVEDMIDRGMTREEAERTARRSSATSHGLRSAAARFGSGPR
jgi:hypothetical protein